MLVLGFTSFSPIYTEIENWDFECYSRLDFPIFPMMKEIKTGVFYVRLSLVTHSFFDQFMLFTHMYLMQGEEIEVWFVSSARREHFGVESAASYCTFCSVNFM